MLHIYFATYEIFITQHGKVVNYLIATTLWYYNDRAEKNCKGKLLITIFLSLYACFAPFCSFSRAKIEKKFSAHYKIIITHLCHENRIFKHLLFNL